MPRPHPFYTKNESWFDAPPEVLIGPARRRRDFITRTLLHKSILWRKGFVQDHVPQRNGDSSADPLVGYAPDEGGMLQAWIFLLVRAFSAL